MSEHMLAIFYAHDEGRSPVTWCPARTVKAAVCRSLLSGIDFLEITDELSLPVIVGERTNVIGSRKFMTLSRPRNTTKPPRSQSSK